jgi:CRISPR-associated protein Cas2
MIEPQAGVFVGNISALVRDKLWAFVLEESPDSSAMLLCSAQTEQGYSIRCAGDSTRRPRDFDGITLIEHAASAAPT